MAFSISQVIVRTDFFREEYDYPAQSYSGEYNSGRMSGRVDQILKPWLIVWGVLALIALAAPGLVAVAMFLIVPGLILVAAPTVFLYSVFFAAFRHFFSMRPGLMRDMAAILSS